MDTQASWLRRSRSDPRHGLTLIEALVMIAIIGILVALLAVAVQSAREAMRRTQCINNLRQIGLALHSYSSASGIYPPGIYGSGYSVHAMLLPYMEMKNVYNMINFDIFAATSLSQSGANQTAANISIDTYACPSDQDATTNSNFNNYAGNRGSGVQKFGYNGAFSFELDGPINFAAFRDGTASTVAMSEWISGRVTLRDNDKRRFTFQTTLPLLKPEELDLFANACRQANSHTSIDSLTKGRHWIIGDFSHTLYNHTIEINGNSCTNGTAIQEGAWTAGSFHPGGANVLFVDGHTRFIKQTTSLDIWRAIGSRDGGEILPSF